MNIGIFTDTFQPDINGVATSITTVKNGLESHNEKVYVVAPNQSFAYQKLPDERIWRLPSIPFYGEGRYRFVFPVNFHMKDFLALPLDVVHTQTPFPVGALGHRVARRNDLPLVHTYHTRYQEYAHYLHVPQRLVRLVSRTGLRQIMRFVNVHDAVIAPSSSIKRELEANGITKPISVIPTGIDLAATARLAASADPRTILEPLGIGPGDEYLIFASRLGKEKNIDFLIDAMQEILKREPALKLLIVGDGDVRKDLQARVVKSGLARSVLFAGFLSHDRLFPLYLRARAFVFSSLTETQGLVILEAMTLGLPVVALRATGVEDALEGDAGGFLIDNNSLAAFVEKTLALIQDEELHKKKSAEAKHQASLFSVETTTARLIALYESVVKAKRLAKAA